MEKFEIYRGKDKFRSWYWRCKFRKNIVATGGEGFPNKSNLTRSIRSLCKLFSSYTLKVFCGKNKKFYWHLKARNGRLMAIGAKSFDTEKKANHAFLVFKKYVGVH